MQNLATCPLPARLPAAPCVPTSPNARIARITFGVLLALLAWDASGLDLAMAHWFGGVRGFPLQENWLLVTVFHDGARQLAWLLALLLCAGVWLPAGPLKNLAFGRRLQLAVTTLLAVSVVSSLKVMSTTSCPWSLADFGGVAHYASHWAHLFESDGGSGRCFPAGHASSGFAFVGGYFVFRHSMPSVAKKWLLAAIVTGLVLGLVQQVRGAHFMSHTLWTGLICWCTAWGMDLAMSRFNFKRVEADLGESGQA